MRVVLLLGKKNPAGRPGNIGCHPGEGREPLVSRTSSGTVGPGLRRDDNSTSGADRVGAGGLDQGQRAFVVAHAGERGDDVLGRGGRAAAILPPSQPRKTPRGRFRRPPRAGGLPRPPLPPPPPRAPPPPARCRA